jgi:hypothetical protein
MTETLRLEAGMLLKCRHCGDWHSVQSATGNAGESEHALAMLYWYCRGGRFYAGQRGAAARFPLRRARVTEVANAPGDGGRHGRPDLAPR